MADLQRFLTPISAEQPAGPDLTYHPLMHALRSSLQGKLEAKVVLDEWGQKRMEEVREEPDWRSVRKLCEELMEAGHHLEVFVTYSCALLVIEGLAGAADGLTLIASLLKEQWTDLQPLLDPDDGLDPSQRLGMVENLSLLPSADDPLRFLGRLRETPLVETRAMGAISLASFKDYFVPQPGTPEALPLESALAALSEAGGLGQLTRVAAAVQQSLDAVKSIDETFLAQAAEGRSPDLDQLAKTLQMQKRLFQWYAKGDEMADALTADGATTAAPLDGAATGSAGTAPAPVLVAARGEITNAQQVKETLERICAYYAKAEPSSPVPLLLQRAHRLVGKGFMEVVQELAGAPVDHIQVVTGAKFPEISE